MPPPRRVPAPTSSTAALQCCAGARVRHRGALESPAGRRRSLDPPASPGHHCHPWKEALIIELRRSPALPLDDIVNATWRCLNPKLSRSAIHRCLQRQTLSAPSPDKPPLSNRHPGRLHPCRRQIPAAAGPSAPLRLCRDRSRHPLCRSRNPPRSPRRHRRCLPGAPSRPLPAPDAHLLTDTAPNSPTASRSTRRQNPRANPRRAPLQPHLCRARHHPSVRRRLM
jgi:hypothetical protein